METIRELVGRLGQVVESKGTLRIAARHRRIVVPASAAFAVDRTIVRSVPIEPVLPVWRPGAQREVAQLLEWMDVPEESEGEASIDVRESALGVDLAAVLGLATGRKVAFANEIPVKLVGADYTCFLPIGPAMDGGLYGPVDSGVRSRVETVVKALVGLPEKQALSLGGAIRMRNAACNLADADHSSAYGLLVAALETLSREFGSVSGSWGDWEQAEGWDAFITELGLCDEQGGRLRMRLLGDRQLRLKRTFVDYAADGLAASFWEESYFWYEQAVEMGKGGARVTEGRRIARPITELVPSDPGELRRRLAKCYDARSQIFHRSRYLDERSAMPFPGDARTPLPFCALRLIVDHLLWREVEASAARAPDLPQFEVRHRPDPA